MLSAIFAALFIIVAPKAEVPTATSTADKQAPITVIWQNRKATSSTIEVAEVVGE